MSDTRDKKSPQSSVGDRYICKKPRSDSAVIKLIIHVFIYPANVLSACYEVPGSVLGLG